MYSIAYRLEPLVGFCCVIGLNDVDWSVCVPPVMHLSCQSYMPSTEVYRPGRSMSKI